MEFLVYKEADKFIGVCLTFDIVEEGNEPATLMDSIKEAAMLHLETVIKENMSDELLNRYAPQTYWDKYFEALENIQKADESALIESPYFSRSPYRQIQSVVTA